jgi:hypothetical protein
MFMEFITLLFFLIAAHGVADFVLQSRDMAYGKSRAAEEEKLDLSTPIEKTRIKKGIRWYHWLTSHAFTHGAFVGLITGNVFLGIFETFAHFLIDHSKCEGKISFNTDQVLHILCKVIYAMIIVIIL